MADAEGQGPPDGLPDLPPEWGRVVVPDDASALADEARRLRRELRRRHRRTIWRRRLGLTPGADGGPPLGLPMLVLLVSVLITLSALAAVTWPRRSGGGPTVVGTPTATAALGPLPALDLVDTGNTPVSLRGLLPAMIVLVDACACAEQVSAAAAAAPPGVTVVTVTGEREVDAAPVPGVRTLADPAGSLRSYLRLAARPGTATALLVDREGTLARVIPELGPVEAYRDDLARLAG